MDTIVDQRDGAAMGQIRSPSTQDSRRLSRRLVTASLTRRATLLGRSGQGLAVEDESQTKNHILDELREKHDLHMRVHRYADLEKTEGDKSFIR